MATHWKKLMDPKDMLFAYDLDGRDVTVTISHVTGGELTGEQGRKTKKPIAHIKGKAKKLALNNTNCQTIEQLTGTSDTEKWRDVRITLFPTTTNFGGKTVECIRIRPYHPKGGKVHSKDEIDTSTAPSIADIHRMNVEFLEQSIKAEWNQKKKWAEEILGRELSDSAQLTDDEVRILRETAAKEDADA